MKIVNPAKVERSALQNAASIAAMVLTTEALVADKPEEKPAAPAMPAAAAAWAAWTTACSRRPIRNRKLRPRFFGGAVIFGKSFSFSYLRKRAISLFMRVIPFFFQFHSPRHRRGNWYSERVIRSEGAQFLG